MIERAKILLLATVVSLCATQSLPVRIAESSEIPAVIQLLQLRQLAEARSNQTIKNKTEVRQAALPIAIRFSEVSLLALQAYQDSLDSRAPPV